MDSCKRYSSIGNCIFPPLPLKPFPHLTAEACCRHGILAVLVAPVAVARIESFCVRIARKLAPVLDKLREYIHLAAVIVYYDRLGHIQPVFLPEQTPLQTPPEYLGQLFEL